MPDVRPNLQLQRMGAQKGEPLLASYVLRHINPSLWQSVKEKLRSQQHTPDGTAILVLIEGLLTRWLQEN